MHGLTTAAVIWVSAGIGLCIGVGFPLLGLGITLLVLMVLVALDPLSDWLGHRGQTRDLELVVPGDVLTLQRIEQVLQQHGVTPNQIRRRTNGSESLQISVHYTNAGMSTQRLLDALAHIEGVHGVAYSDAQTQET